MATTKLSRREREKLRHRNEILEAALDLFSESGFHNVSVHAIAEKAEFAIGTLYTFFEGKEDIYRALMLEHAEVFRTVLTAALQEEGDDYTKILRYVRVKGEVFMSNAKVVRLYVAETRGTGFNVKSGMEAGIRESYEEVLTKLAGVFQSGIRKKAFLKLDPYYMAVALDSITNAALFLWLEEPKRHPYQRTVKTMARIFFEQTKLG